jgi:hypothetical protein
MYLRHQLTKVCILHQISLVTNHVSHPYNSTDFIEALKILILVSFLIDVDSHTFLSLEIDPLADQIKMHFFSPVLHINYHFLPRLLREICKCVFFYLAWGLACCKTFNLKGQNF